MSGTRLGGTCAGICRLMVAIGFTFLVAACSGMRGGDSYEGSSASQPATPSGPSGPIGAGQVKVGLVLPLTAAGNAAVAARSVMLDGVKRSRWPAASSRSAWCRTST